MTSNNIEEYRTFLELKDSKSKYDCIGEIYLDSKNTL